MTAMPRPRGRRATIAAARGLTGNPCPTLDRLAAGLGATFGVDLGPLHIAVVGEPAHLAELLAYPISAFEWGHRFNVLRFFVGDGSVIVSDGDEHRRRRAMVQPAFARRRLDQWAPMIVQETDRVVDSLAARDQTFDLFPVGRRLVLDVVTEALFGRGLPADGATFERLIEPAKTYLEQSGLRQLPHPLPYTRRARCRAARQELDSLVDAEIARRRAQPPPESGDVLDLLLADDDPATAPTDAEIRDQVITLIAAGYDTTASALAWTLLAAASTPGVWERLRAEADAVFSADVGPRTQQELEYARAVVHESLRLYPPGVFAPRRAVSDIDVGPYRIARGTMILWCPYLSGRDAATWPDPLAFRPERHLHATDKQAAVMRAAWVPFGRGPRQCVGFALAEMELVLMTARLAQRIDVELRDAAMPEPYGMVVNRPRGGVVARVRPRRQPDAIERV